MTMARTLRAKIDRGVLVSTPSAADALLTTRLIEQAGFESVYVTGFGGKTAHLGKPDLGLSTTRRLPLLSIYVCFKRKRAGMKFKI